MGNNHNSLSVLPLPLIFYFIPYPFLPLPHPIVCLSLPYPTPFSLTFLTLLCAIPSSPSLVTIFPPTFSHTSYPTTLPSPSAPSAYQWALRKLHKHKLHNFFLNNRKSNFLNDPYVQQDPRGSTKKRKRGRGIMVHKTGGVKKKTCRCYLVSWGRGYIWEGIPIIRKYL